MTAFDPVLKLVYGSEAITGCSLRFGAMLRSTVIGGRQLPPNSNRGGITAGDGRATLFRLAALHFLPASPQQKLGRSLEQSYKSWNTRTYKEFVSELVGEASKIILVLIMGVWFGSACSKNFRYNPNVELGILNEFAAGAYRLHGMIQETYPLKDASFREFNQYRFLDGVQKIDHVLGNIDSRGMMSVPIRSPQRITTSVTERLFGGTVVAKTGSLVGGTFACVIAKQFERLRDGDRFYCENPGIFTSAQVAELKRATLSWVLCKTGDNMVRVSRRAFDIENGSRTIPCSSIPGLNLEAWRE